MRDRRELIWVDAVATADVWTSKMSGVRFKSTSNSEWEEYQVDDLDVVTDTGTSCVFIPEKYF